MVGTLPKAFLNEASAMLLMACKPARINSLFLTSMPSAIARFFMSVICRNSVLGRVKLSRTTLTFFSLTGLAGVDFAGSALAVLLTGLTEAFTAGWVTGLAGLA